MSGKEKQMKAEKKKQMKAEKKKIFYVVFDVLLVIIGMAVGAILSLLLFLLLTGDISVLPAEILKCTLVTLGGLTAVAAGLAFYKMGWFKSLLVFLILLVAAGVCYAIYKVRENARNEGFNYYYGGYGRAPDYGL